MGKMMADAAKRSGIAGRLGEVLTIPFLYLATLLLLIESNIVYVQVGDFSLSAYFTLLTPLYLLTVIGLVLLGMRNSLEGSAESDVVGASKATVLTLSPFIALLFAGLLSLGFSWRLEGLQNLLALAVFVSGVLVSAITRPDWNRYITEKAFPMVGLVSATLFIVTQIVDTETRFGIEFFSPRQYGMVALVSLAAALTTTRKGFLYTHAPYIIFASLIFSASRTAAATGLIIFLISLYQKSTGWKNLAKHFLALILSGAVFAALGALAVRDVSERLSGGGAEQTDILSDSGRFNAWAQFLSLPESALDWFIGLGSGASAEFGQRELPHFPQTLNEYLRFLVDHGILGLLLFLAGLLLLLYRAKTWNKGQTVSSNAAGLTVIVLALVSLTDGAFYSYFVVLPASILIGRMFNSTSPLDRRVATPE